jgi:hypothetical protein
VHRRPRSERELVAPGHVPLRLAVSDQADEVDVADADWEVGVVDPERLDCELAPWGPDTAVTGVARGSTTIARSGGNAAISASTCSTSSLV